MLNNQIIITDDTLLAYRRRNHQGIVDAVELTDVEWEELCARNVNSTRVRIVKCAKCWELYREVQWMQAFNRMGTRIVRHQPSEQRPDHAYEAVETPEHKAYVNRTLTVWDIEGYTTGREVWTPDRKARNDAVASDAPNPIAYEFQHSPFSNTSRYSAPERTRHAEAAGYTVLWHSNNRAVRGQVPILRTDGGLPLEVIENLNYRHEFRGGLYRIEIYTCTVRDGHECPNRKFSGCGQPHARGQITVGQDAEGGKAPGLDDVLRGAPVGAYVPVVDAQVIRAPRFFWTDRKSYDRYLAYIAGSEAVPLLDGFPVHQGKARRGARVGHSRAKELELEAMRARAVDLSALATPPPERIRPRAVVAARRCTGAADCLSTATRLYPCGWRCPDHTPARMAGRPEPPPGPGWPTRALITHHAAQAAVRKDTAQ